MSGNDDFEHYPHGQLSLGAGKLRQATDFTLKHMNNSKVQHTLRTSSAGVVMGAREGSFTLSSVIPESGEERDYLEMVQTGAKKQGRFEVPNRGIVATLVLSEVEFGSSVNNAVTVRISGHAKVIV